ncbi:MAG TPA: hypothetical protein VMS88_07270, partial [Terriglobales bacterium]|nr:hypothetical protein [Terriglobales bacterium]
WMLEPFSRPLGRVGNGLGFDTLAMPALAELREGLYAEEGKRRASAALLGRLDARGLAVWYGDDGSFGGSYARWGHGTAVIYNKSLESESRARVAATLERLGIGTPRDDGRGFWFDAEQTARLHALVAPYLHPTLEHKLHPSERGKYAWKPDLSDAHLNGTRLQSRRRLRTVPARIAKKYTKPRTRATHRFDLEVEGNHTYLADGVVVHNSPETTAGGRALKFYASVRLDIRRIATLKEGDSAIGNRTRVKVVKNKVAAPFREAEFDILYNEGISREGELLDLAIEKNVVQKAGTWLSFGDERIGQGRENARLFLKEHADVRAKIEAKVLPAIGLKVREAAPAAASGTPGSGGEAAPKSAAPTPPARPGAPPMGPPRTAAPMRAQPEAPKRR